MRTASWLCIAFGALAWAACSDDPHAAVPSSSIVIRDVRVFDGTSVLERATVVIEGDHIVDVGAAPAIPSDAQIVDGAGKTLLPGLIDAHAHVWHAGHLVQSAMLGVTTVLDMGCGDPRLGTALRSSSSQRGSASAEMRFAGFAVTVPDGHCTEYGFPVPTITGVEQVTAFVDARVAEGSDYIKIIYDDIHEFGLNRPTLSREILAASIEAAHQHGKLAMVHIGTADDARDAIEAGADGLAHLFVDRAPDPDFGPLLASHRAFAEPTLSVLRASIGSSLGPSLAADPRLARYLTPTALTELGTPFPTLMTTANYAAAEEAVRLLKNAGVPILAGTDAPNFGTAHGATVHGELELLVNAGLSPVEALVAATSAPAARFGLPDRGRVAAGLRADLVLVSGDPTSDIHATRDIDAVWKAGARLDREGYASSL